MMSNAKNIWFPEPDVIDDTWGTHGETFLSWLSRSTLTRAKAARQFLNYNISQLPATWRDQLYHDLNHRWNSAFFELVVARTLQALGADLQIEQITTGGRRPDFRAAFASGTIVVEAVSPVIDSVIDEQFINSAPLLKIIEQRVPQGATVLIGTLPNLGPSDSKREFKQIVSRLLDVPTPQGDEVVELYEETANGLIELSLLARREKWPAIGSGPGVTFFSNRIDRLRRAIRRKRQQVRHGNDPVILAINGNWRCNIEDVDRVVFGSTVQHWNGIVEHLNDGEFTKSQSESPTYAALLFYQEVGFTCPAEPVLFLHPRNPAKLPAELEVITQRGLVGQHISEASASGQGILGALKPVNLQATE
ncbi:MAG: hypothetical protein M3R24_41350 [Chloroflexota bacterium]|nr:hypothetical protein [Chloroflexota bacterium]